MFWKYNMKCSFGIIHENKYNYRTEYKVTNGKYIKYIDRNILKETLYKIHEKNLAGK